jgi:hypothetical protein
MEQLQSMENIENNRNNLFDYIKNDLEINISFSNVASDKESFNEKTFDDGCHITRAKAIFEHDKSLKQSKRIIFKFSLDGNPNNFDAEKFRSRAEFAAEWISNHPILVLPSCVEKSKLELDLSRYFSPIKGALKSSRKRFR